MTAWALIDQVALQADVKYLTFKAHPTDVLRKGLGIRKPLGRGFLRGVRAAVPTFFCPPPQRDFAQGLSQLRSDQLLPHMLTADIPPSLSASSSPFVRLC